MTISLVSTVLSVLGRLERRLQREVRMSVNKGLEAVIGFRIGNLPWKPSEDHAHENDGYAPNISLSGVIRLVVENLRCEVGITANDTGGRSMRFARVMKNGSSAEINELDNIVWGHDAIIKLEVAVGKAHFVKIFNTVTYLAKYAVDLRAAHLGRHDDAEEIKWSVLHYLIIMTMIGDDVKGVYDVGVFQGGTDAKLGSNLFLVLFFTLTRTLGSEFLGGIDRTTILGASFYEANGASSASAQDATQFSIFF